MPRSLMLRSLILGACLGFVLSSLGFSDYSEMMKMLTLSDFRLMAAFAGAVTLGAVAFKFDVSLCRTGGGQARIRGKILAGAAIFGLGWGLIGSCPAVPLVQLGEGQLFALVSALGIFAGMRLANWMSQRFRWSRDSCT